MATLKKLTRVGADVRQIARLLQAKAPEGHMLAYITPEEAKLLKSQGGSGKPHEDTGIPSFEYDPESYYSVPEAGTPAYTPSVTTTDLPSVPEVDNTYAFSYPSGFDAPVGADRFAGASQAAPFELPSVAGQTKVSEGAPYEGYATDFAGAFPAGAFAPPEGGAGRGYTPYQVDTTPEKGIMDRLSETTGLSKETLKTLGLAGGLGLYGAYKSKKAADEARKAKEEQQKLAAPYQTKGAELQRAAQAGELTPAAQQQLQAVQAQAAQQASGRGGAISAAQTQAQIETFRNQLLAQQYQQQRADLAPFTTAGLGAQNQLLTFLGLPGGTQGANFGKYSGDFTGADLLANQDPGYGFRLAEGQKALERSAAARGGLLSGGTGKALTNFGQQMGSLEYQNAYNRYQTNRTNQLSPLFSLTGSGQASAAGQAAAAGNYGAGAAGNLTSAGAAQAAGDVGAANAVSSGLSSYLGYTGQQNLINALRKSAYP